MLNITTWSELAASTFRAAEGRKMPLVHTAGCGEPGKTLLRSSPRDLFPSSREPEAMLAGLLLYLNCWDEAHNLAQDIPTADGSYWHAIVHRMEPDASNSGYWFRRVGRHAIFPELQRRAQAIAAEHPEAGYHAPKEWDPFRFIDDCERASTHPRSELEQVMLEIQHAEWELLIAWCQG